ncbi:MAG TPA: hypothetical protein VGX23_28795 [Actinocrinis sp.]|nr:hypothetical protein [Actinocrinis sp.]
MTTENDDQLTELFTIAAADLYPPITEMLEYGMTRGAAVRRRRTALGLAGGAGALAVIVAVTVSLVHPGLPAPAPAAAPANQASAVAAGPDGGAATSAVYYQLLTSLLPDGTVFAAAGGTGSGAAADYNDGSGEGEVQVTTQLFSDDHLTGSSGIPTTSESCTGWSQGTNLGPRPADAPAPGCTDTVTPAGITEITMVTGTDPNGVYFNEIEYFRQDGVEVTATAGNGVTEVDGASRLTRDAPVLSIAQLTAIAANPRW